MYEQTKILVQKKPLLFVGVILVLIAIGAVIYFSSGRSTDTDYQRTRDTMERAQEQQRKSIELNQSVRGSVDRSTELNLQAGQRIDRLEEYQQSTSRNISTSQERLSEARSLLERNAELFRSIEQTNQKKP